MKLTSLFLIAVTIQVSAKSLAQTVTLSAENIPLKKVFHEIRKQTGYQFFYQAELIKNAKNIATINVKKASLNDVLKLCFKDQPFTYEIVENAIVIKELPNEGRVLQAPPPQTEIRGKVIDESGNPMAGVSVIIARTGKGVSTDKDGNYTIVVPEKATLEFSFVGFKKQALAVGNKTVINIILVAEPLGLDNIVVIGYGSIKQRNVAGSIASVKAKDMDISTASNFSQALQGKAAGVQVIQSTGQPGASVSIQLRSNPSNANAGVLYIIDGVPINDAPDIPGAPSTNLGGTDQSPLNFINPNDIESIDFLKDAASASIYGARAGAGVVLITTKRGKTGLPTVSYSGSQAFQKVDKMFKVLDTKTYMEQANLIGLENWMQTNKIAPYYGSVDASTVTPYQPMFSQRQIDTTPRQPSAMDAITRSGLTQQHNISLSGGTDKTKYYISGNYYNQRGVIIATDYTRYNLRINLDQTISDRVKTGVNFITSNSLSHTTGTGGLFENGGIITAALYYPPILPLVNADGTYPLNPRYTPIPNPLSYQTVDNQASVSRLLTNGYIEWEIIKHLKARGNFSYDQSTAKRDVYLPSSFSKGAAVGGLASKGANSTNVSLLEYTLGYDWKIGTRQTVNALAGYSYNVTTGDGLYAQNQNFVSDAFSYYNLGAGQNISPGVGSMQRKTVWASYVARVIYSLDDKYTLQATIRRDGSDKFAENKKWGYFPGVALGWLVSEENFMKPISLINYLKLRVSYGEIGNSNIGNNAFAAYGPGASPLFGNNQPSTGIVLTQAANPNLTWETAADFNLGVDFGLFRSRITGSFDYFNKTIRNLLTYVPFPADFTVGGVWSNAGTTKSVGYDIGIQSKNIVSQSPGGFTWSTNITFSHYLNYWTKRSPQALAVLAKYIEPSGKRALFNGIYGYVSDGIYTGANGKGPAQMNDMLPGSIILKDIHGYDANGNLTGPDGHITAADQTLLGNWDPKFSFGIGNNFTFSNFDLSIFFSGLSRKAMSPYGANSQYRIVGLNANLGSFGWNTMPVSLSRWTFQNPGNTFPTGLSDPKYASFQGASNYWIIDGSFLRCRNITLGYSIPSSVLQKQHILTGVRISFDVQNPFTITSYPGLDAELNVANYYPLAKSYVLGVRLGF